MSVITTYVPFILTNKMMAVSFSQARVLKGIIFFETFPSVILIPAVSMDLFAYSVFLAHSERSLMWPSVFVPSLPFDKIVKTQVYKRRQSIVPENENPACRLENSQSSPHHYPVGFMPFIVGFAMALRVCLSNNVQRRFRGL